MTPGAPTTVLNTPLPMLVSLVVIAFLLYSAVKLGGRTLVFALVGVAILSAFWMFTSFQRVPQTMSTVAIVDDTHTKDNQHFRSTSELWDKFTESKIPLDADAKIELDSKPEAAAAESRPAWVDHPPKRVGNVVRQVVVSDRFATVDECYHQLEQLFDEVVQKRLQTLVGNQILQSAHLDVGLDYVMREICREERVHVLMEFTSAVDEQLRQMWQMRDSGRRMANVGLIVGATLGCLAMVYGLLRFDTWTRGYYTKQLLLFGVPGAIILIAMLLFG